MVEKVPNPVEPTRPRRVVTLRHPGRIGAAKAQAQTPTAAEPPAPPRPPAVVPRPNAPQPNAPVAAHSRILVDAIVSTFTQRLKTEVARRGGRLTAADIDRIATDLDGKRAQLEAVFSQSIEAYMRAHQRAAFDHARQYPFDRLIVNTFAELFTPLRADLDGLDRVTRKVLPGFFLALDKMLPPDRIEGFQERCRAILARLSPSAEAELNWQSLYDDAEANDLLIDALAALAPYFESFEKRRNWFLPLVNDNLHLDVEDDWVLTPRGFDRLARAMFTSLRAELTDTSIRNRLLDRYSAAECLKLRNAVDAIWNASEG